MKLVRIYRSEGQDEDGTAAIYLQACFEDRRNPNNTVEIVTIPNAGIAELWNLLEMRLRVLTQDSMKG